MLAQSEVTGYLLERALIAPDAVVDRHLTIVDVSSRNQNWAVSADGLTGLFLKQDTANRSARGRNGGVGSSLAREAVVYELVASLPRRTPQGGISALLPRCLGYDPEHRLLILELLQGAEDLSTYHGRTGRFSVSLAARLGSALGDLHEHALVPAQQRPGDFAGRLPWALALDRPGTSLWREASNAGLQLIGILQSVPQMRAVLAELRQGWRVDAFIHHDIKWDNCLVIPAGASRRSTRLALVDWEFADLGDSHWDAGAVFGNYLSFWLMSIPVTGGEPPDRYLDLARFPLARMQPAMRSYWAAYATARGWDHGTADEALVRSVRYAGARLLQSAYEQTQRMTRLDGNSVCLLQLALNVMVRPLEAINLLGLAEGKMQA